MINTILLLAVLAMPAKAQTASPSEPVLSDTVLAVPGMADFLRTLWNNKRAVYLVDANGISSVGAYVAVRSWHDPNAVTYQTAGLAAVIKQGEHLRPRLVTMTDISAVVRRAEVGWRWYDQHTTRLKLPDFWGGPYLSLPLPGDPVRFSSFSKIRSWLPYLGASISIGI